MDQDPTFVPTGHFDRADKELGRLNDLELAGLVGAVVAEYVNRGNDHETALDLVMVAAHAGVEGSRLFDQMEA